VKSLMTSDFNHSRNSTAPSSESSVALPRNFANRFRSCDAPYSAVRAARNRRAVPQAVTHKSHSWGNCRSARPSRGVLYARGVVYLLLESGVRVDFVRHEIGPVTSQSVMRDADW
jgi:hypothetical protein